MIKEFLTEKLASGLSPNSVRIIHATFRAMLNEAVEDEIITANPSARLGKKLRLAPTSKQRQQAIKAMDRVQVSAFLEATAGARNKDQQRYHPLFLLLARTGLRLGEAIALEVDDVRFDQNCIRVERAFSAGYVLAPKNGEGRDVDMSQQLATTLRKMIADRRQEWFRASKGEIPKLLFPSETATILDGANIRRAVTRSLKAAELPRHFIPHCLRHTFASLLLQQGESLAYVQKQLVYASIKLTVDTYGMWLPMGNKGAVDRLDDGNGSKVVADAQNGDTTLTEAV